MTGEGKTARRWTWGDWVLLLLPLAALPVVAETVGSMSPTERSTGWMLFFGAAAVASVGAGVFVYRFLAGGERADPATQRRNRARNTGLALTFGVASLFFVRRASEGPRLVAMGLAFGGVTVAMLGYALHVVRTRRAGGESPRDGG